MINDLKQYLEDACCGSLVDLVDARMEKLGAVENKSQGYRWHLETPFGILHIHPYKDWVAMRFDEVEKAKKKFGTTLFESESRFGFNPYSGKYNVSVCENKDPMALFRLFEWKLGLVMNSK